MNKILAATEQQMHRAVSAGANEAKQTAETLVPVDNGDLKSTLDVDDDGRGHAAFSAGGQSKINPDKTVGYAAPVEFGSTHTTAGGKVYSIPAQPYFRPGVDAGRRKMRSQMKITDR